MGRFLDPLRFTEAWEWFQRKVPLRKGAWSKLDGRARRRSFTAAGVSSLDVLNTVWEGIDKALAEGTSFAEFRGAVSEDLESAWGEEIPGRVENIFRTNTQSAYAAGRYAQMTDPEMLEDRPWWEFVAILDDATTTICRPLEGMCRASQDPFWQTHFPPLHFQCRSTVITHADRPRHATSDTKGADVPLDGFGLAPDLGEWKPSAADYPAPLWRAYTNWAAQRGGTHEP